MKFLTPPEREELRIKHKRERDGRVRDRIKAVLLSDSGWSAREIAEALLISDQAVCDHLEDYKTSHKLKPENGGSEEKLSKEQADQLEIHLREHTYLYVKDILEYVQATFKETYTVAGMTNWLRRHGFSYKKPAAVPGKADKERQQQWIAEYENLRQDLSANETICFTDGVHPTHNVQPAYGWIKTGVRKEISANTGRSRLNLSGIIDVITHNVLVAEDTALNADSTIRFFQKVEAAYPTKTKLHVFCDNASYYRNKAVTQYLATSKIVLHFLPPYSPNLNPIERLWKWMKERVIYNTYYEHFEDFKRAVVGFFETLPTLAVGSVLGQSLRSRVKDKFRPIGAPVANS